jgi:6-phosphogluconolactonase
MNATQLPGGARVNTDPIAVAAASAQWISEKCDGGSTFSIAFSGGGTPRFLYEALASSTFRESIEWARWHVLFADERAVPPDHPQSNYRLVHDSLLSRVAVPHDQVHRMEAERPDLDTAAEEYSQLLEAECGNPPRLDVILLGLGADGHTASLFAGSVALDVDSVWATRGQAPSQPINRITLTLPVLNAAAQVAFLVTGPNKGEALRGVIDGTVPAARVRPKDGEIVWFLDDPAARSIG